MCPQNPYILSDIVVRNPLTSDVDMIITQRLSAMATRAIVMISFEKDFSSLLIIFLVIKYSNHIRFSCLFLASPHSYRRGTPARVILTGIEFDQYCLCTAY
jgi:hypothetical protein